MVTVDESLIDMRPRMRGWIHLWSAVVAVVTGTTLVVGAASQRGVAAAVACGVYAGSVCLLFGVSASYHRIRWSSAAARRRMKRADHSMIFVFIAGSYTPLCALGLSTLSASIVLSVVWTGAVAGVAMKITWPDSPRWLGVILYLILGWTIVIVSPQLLHNVGGIVVSLLALGGVLYSVGGILYAAKWPNPWPTTFAHHEFFHAATVVAALSHYTAIWILVLQ